MMSAARLNDIWQAVQTLDPAERQRLREWLNRDTPIDQSGLGSAERAVERVLTAHGVITPAAAGPDDVRAFQQWRPVKVEGKPVSETLLEERR